MDTDWALVTLVSQAQLPILNKPVRDTIIVNRRKKRFIICFPIEKMNKDSIVSLGSSSLSLRH